MYETCPECTRQGLIEQSLEFQATIGEAEDLLISRVITEVTCPECGWYEFLEDQLLYPCLRWVLYLENI